MVKRHTYLAIAVILAVFIGGFFLVSGASELDIIEDNICKKCDPPRANGEVPEDSNGMKFPVGYRSWKFITLAKTNLKEFTVTLGNDIAVKAAREMNTRPWPDGTVLVRVVWKPRKMTTWPNGVTAGDFIQLNMMVKDAEKYKDTLGWGFAQWDGMGLNAHATGKNQAEGCVGCHEPLGAKRDYVFNDPAILP